MSEPKETLLERSKRTMPIRAPRYREALKAVSKHVRDGTEPDANCPTCGWSVHAYGCYLGQCHDPNLPQR